MAWIFRSGIDRVRTIPCPSCTTHETSQERKGKQQEEGAGRIHSQWRGEGKLGSEPRRHARPNRRLLSFGFAAATASRASEREDGEKEQSPVVRMGERARTRATNILTGQGWHCLAGARSRRSRRKAAVGWPRRGFDAGGDTIELLENRYCRHGFHVHACGGSGGGAAGTRRHGADACVWGRGRAWWWLTCRPTEVHYSMESWPLPNIVGEPWVVDRSLLGR
jgi:hypothetical protein